MEVPASHVSFLSQPEAATQLILQAVEATAVSWLTIARLGAMIVGLTAVPRRR